MNRGYGSSPSKIMIVGEIYSQDDFHKQEPFSGNSGIEFNRMLHEAHIMRSECYLTNVVNGRPPNGTLRYWLPKRKTEVQHGYHTQHNGEWVSPEILKGFAQLCDEIAEVQPNVIVACGDLPLWLLTGASGVDKWRGSVLTARNLRSSQIGPVEQSPSWTCSECASTQPLVNPQNSTGSSLSGLLSRRSPAYFRSCWPERRWKIFGLTLTWKRELVILPAQESHGLIRMPCVSLSCAWKTITAIGTPRQKLKSFTFSTSSSHISE
jgi:uracil-DNA glycosylase